MRVVQQHSQFRRDLKRAKRSGDCSFEELLAEIEIMKSDSSILGKLRDHPLKGRWKPARECHIRPDLLFVYEKTDAALILLRLGSYSELFR